MFNGNPFPARWRGLVLFAFGLLLTTGCGNGQKPVYKVHGQVFDANKMPAVGALVTFHPANADPNDPLKPIGKVDEQGNYSLTTYIERDGAPEGTYVITVVWPTPKKTPFDADKGDQLKGTLGRPEQSPHKFIVEKKSNQEVPAITLPDPGS
jgi:hypothetical protein